MKSPIWYLLPAFLGIIGGVIAYAILKNVDPQKAKKALIIGIIVTIPYFAWIGLQATSGTFIPFYHVYGSSMAPVILDGDLIYINGNEPFEEVRVGDIIIFKNPSDPNRTNFARVVSITNEDPKTIRTQGDANPASIPGTDFPITEEEYIGKVAYIIPQLGYIVQSPNPIILIVMYVGIIFGVVLFKRQKFQEILDSELPSSTPVSPKKSQKENITDIDKQIAINEEKIRKMKEESKKLDEED
jgi:signal peptidase I